MISPAVRLAVIDTVHRWSHVADGSDAAAIASVVTDDASFVVEGGETYIGLPAIEAALGAEMAERAVQPRRHVRNTVFDIEEPERVVTRSYYLLTGVGSTGMAEALAAGVYEDELVPDGTGSWRIRRRIARPDGQPDAGLRA